MNFSMNDAYAPPRGKEQILGTLFEQHFHIPVEIVTPLHGELGGSGRKLTRLSAGGRSAIGVQYNVREENVAFLKFSRHFRKHGLPVPEIFIEDLDHGAYLEEDLGDTTLFDYLSKQRQGVVIPKDVLAAYKQVVAQLPRFQIQAGKDLDYSVCYPRDRFDRQSITWDLNYFKYYFLRLSGIGFNEQELENDFEKLTSFLLTANCNYFLYRDFQSRNIMWREGSPFFIDYQGGRRGALQYDVASLLYDAKADLTLEMRQELLDHYLASANAYERVDAGEFMHHFYAYVYVRILQAMGAYGFRGFYERKAHFLHSVPYALKNVAWLLENVRLPIEIPTLTSAFSAMLSSPKLTQLASADPPLLTVRIYSFSYKKDFPRDETGHGGGFVFDVRSLPNPGREERFKALTGRDAAVGEYLNHEESVHQYLASVLSLVEASVANYQSRGFDSLTVAFGCTGGQHRSVYMAEQLAKKLRTRQGVRTTIRHVALESFGK
jgi:aminoglycoside/choline kinase family phosphotransferase